MSNGVEIISRGERGFEAIQRAAHVNALLPTERPDAVALPRSEAEVAAIVADAAASGRRVSVRSGGHSWAATSLRDGGILLDLAHLDAIELDAENLTARVQPGVRVARLAAELVAAGVAFPVGHCGAPGVGGYLVGGGLGVNWGVWRPAVSSIRSVRLITATGEILTASATENVDWFWLVRGAGPTLPAVVTSFDLQLRPLPGDIRVTGWTYPLDSLPQVGRWITAASHELPPRVELPIVLAGPGRPGASPDDEPFVVGVTAIAYARDAAESAASLSPLADGADATPISRLQPAPASFAELHIPVDDTYPEGARFLADTFWSDHDLSDALTLLTDLVRSAPSGKSYVLASMPANGAGATLVDETETAFSVHDRTIVTVYAIWDDPTDDEANALWMDAVAAALAPITTGHFLNEADIRRHPERIAASFTPTAWERVLRLRARFDPSGVFYTFPID